MSETPPLLFILIWGLFALGLGALFLFRPDIPADAYIEKMSRARVTNRLRERLAPRRRILAWYRVGGATFMVLGVAVPAISILTTHDG